MKGLIVLSNNCEDAEAIGPKALLERAGIKIDTVTFNKDKIVKAAYKSTFIADYYIDEIRVDDYDFLVVPGGSYVIETISTDINVKGLIKAFSNKNKLVAAICAAPMFLGELGLLENKDYTVFPSCESDDYKGSYKANLKAVTDKNIITGRSVGAIFEFSYEIVKYLKGKAKADKLISDTYY